MPAFCRLWCGSFLSLPSVTRKRCMRSSHTSCHTLTLTSASLLLFSHSITIILCLHSVRLRMQALTPLKNLTPWRHCLSFTKWSSECCFLWRTCLLSLSGKCSSSTGRISDCCGWCLLMRRCIVVSLGMTLSTHRTSRFIWTVSASSRKALRRMPTVAS